MLWYNNICICLNLNTYLFVYCLQMHTFAFEFEIFYIFFLFWNKMLNEICLYVYKLLIWIIFDWNVHIALGIIWPNRFEKWILENGHFDQMELIKMDTMWTLECRMYFMTINDGNSYFIQQKFIDDFPLIIFWMIPFFGFPMPI